MKLERNASVCMKALPFWIIPYTYYMYYLSLYLMEKGMDSGHVTTLMTISNISALFFSFFAAPIVDRMGRKNSLLVFDLVSSVLPALIFLLNASFVSVALGMILVGMNRIMSTAYYLLLIEDTSDKNRFSQLNHTMPRRISSLRTSSRSKKIGATPGIIIKKRFLATEPMKKPCLVTEKCATIWKKTMTQKTLSTDFTS